MAATLDIVREQAELIARDSRQADPAIRDVFWFADPDEVRLVETTPEVPVSQEGAVYPFYFPARPDQGLPLVSAIAQIRPEEVRQVRLPEGWGTWDEAVRL